MELKVGARSVTHTARLLLPPDEEGFIVFRVQEFTAKLRIVFAIDKESAKKQGIEVVVDGDTATIKFLNWTNSLGSATARPIPLAKLDNGQAVHFMAAHWAVGTMNCLDMQFLLSEAP